ncbi:MAG: RNA 2',3'-cyclic phosphodiesterase [Pseudomonadota bacterium]
MPRLFTGLELPDDIRDDLSGLDLPIGGARWVSWDDYHLTLRFAGDIDPQPAAEWHRYLEDIDVDAFQMKIKGVGVFTEKEPRTLWAGVEAGPELDVLARAHERAARNAGLGASRQQSKGRAFRPHITLARLRNPPIERVVRILKKFANFESEPFMVTHFSLFSARPGGGGGPYVVEDTFPLLGALSRAGYAGEHREDSAEADN